MADETTGTEQTGNDSTVDVEAIGKAVADAITAALKPKGKPDDRQESAGDSRETPKKDEDASHSEDEGDEGDEEFGDEEWDALMLRQAKMAAVVAHYLPEGVKLDDEIDHVVGLSMKDGEVTGEARYRPAQPKQNKRPSNTGRKRNRGSSTNGTKQSSETFAGII